MLSPIIKVLVVAGIVLSGAWMLEVLVSEPGTLTLLQ